MRKLVNGVGINDANYVVQKFKSLLISKNESEIFKNAIVKYYQLECLITEVS